MTLPGLALPGPAHPGPGRWWWLSFRDPDKPKGQQALGVVIVEGDFLRDAIKQSWRLGINPGGEVLSVVLTDRVPVARWRNRLLTREEAGLADKDNEPAFDA